MGIVLPYVEKTNTHNDLYISNLVKEKLDGSINNGQSCQA